MRNYGYNYDFLAEWLKEHPRMKGQAAKAIGTSPAGINRWLVDIDNPEHRERHCDKHGRVVKPMKLERMIEFCNQLDANLSSFFIDSGEAAEIKPVAAPKHTTLMRFPNQDETVLKLKYVEETNKLLNEINELHKKNETLQDLLLEKERQVGNQSKMLALYENGYLHAEKKDEDMPTMPMAAEESI